MRASNFSLVFATGCSLLWAVGAQDIPQTIVDSNAPSNVGVVSSTLTAGAPYTVTWDACSVSCSVAGATLLEIQPPIPPMTIGTPVAIQSIEGIACGGSNNGGGVLHYCFTDIAPRLIATYTYEIDVAYRTIGESGPATHVTGTPLTIDPSPVSDITTSAPASSVTPSNGRATTSMGTQVPAIPSNIITTAPSTLASTSAVPSTAAVLGTNNDSSGLSTGAKVGIAIGAVGFALLVLVAALLIWRRRRQRQLRALPNGMPYSHDTGSTNRDFTTEKEMHIISSPVDTLHNGYSSIPPAAETQSRSPTESYPLPEDHAAADAAPYTDANRRSYGSGLENSASPVQESQAHMPTLASVGGAIQRKPVGATSGPTHHLREPGMSDDEVARLEEEERRLDEAIAEAERRRQLQG